MTQCSIFPILAVRFVELGIGSVDNANIKDALWKRWRLVFPALAVIRNALFDLILEKLDPLI
jgi:hypothetical protein